MAARVRSGSLSALALFNRGADGGRGARPRAAFPVGGLARPGAGRRIGARLADVVLATSLASGPHPADPTALPHWPVPPDSRNAAPGPAVSPRAEPGCAPGRPLRVGFSADLGYARPFPGVARIVAQRVTELAGAGAIDLADVTVTLADPQDCRR
jgi:hypothetical protein